MCLLSTTKAGIKLAELRRRSKPYTADYIKQLITCKPPKLTAQKVGKGWIIRESDLIAYFNKYKEKLSRDGRSLRFYDL